jgi:thiosulfate reductase cytochrome b subunit
MRDEGLFDFKSLKTEGYLFDSFHLSAAFVLLGMWLWWFLFASCCFAPENSKWRSPFLLFFKQVIAFMGDKRTKQDEEYTGAKDRSSIPNQK